MKTISKILVCTDFSNESKNALIYGVNLAEQLQVPVTILHVKTENSGTDEDIEAHFRDIRHDYLFLAKGSYEFMVRPGNIAETVKEVIREQGIGLTIVGMRRVSTHKEVLSGSITASLIERPCSALLNVPAKSRMLRISHIGIASDGLDPDTEALDTLLNLSKKLDARISVFHVHRASVPEPEEMAASMENAYGNVLGDVFSGYADVEGENVVTSVSTYAEEHHIDLLTVLHHCGGEVRNPLRRSISKQLAFRTKVPLLILPVK